MKQEIIRNTEAIVIKIWKSSNTNHFEWEVYNKFDENYELDEQEPSETGECTSEDILVALRQATDTAEELITETN